MNSRPKKLPSALRHGGYSSFEILPGESAADFKRLHRELIAELISTGPLEEDVVMTLTRLVWRKKNLATFRLAASARARNSEILAQAEPRFIPPTFPMLGQFEPDERTPEELSAAREEAKEQAREELGETLQLVEMGNDATVERFFEELNVVDRIDSMIDRCIKRLLMVRGVKSMSVSPRRKPSLSGKRRAA